MKNTFFIMFLFLFTLGTHAQNDTELLAHKIGIDAQEESTLYYFFYRSATDEWWCQHWILDAKGVRIHQEVLPVTVTKSPLQTQVKIGEQIYQYGVDTEGPPDVNGRAFRWEYLVTLILDEKHQLIRLSN